MQCTMTRAEKPVKTINLPILKSSKSCFLTNIEARVWVSELLDGCLNAKSRSNAEVSNEKVAKLLNLRDDAPDKII